MLTRYEFEVMKSRVCGGPMPQREIARQAGISVGSVNKAIRQLKARDLLDDGGEVTAEGYRAFEPYRVENAVILAAGMATRFAPLSFERPKAMFKVHGEVLIERMIRQLKEAGICDITVVVGYMKEAFFYLEDELGVKIVVNPDYVERNNHSSLWVARSQLGNTYVLSSDQHYERNIFEPYQYQACCSASYSTGATSEQVLDVDAKGFVRGVSQGGEGAYFMQGPAYFDREFSQAFMAFLESDYDLPETADMLWEQVFAKHADELDMQMRVFETGVIHEFDYLTDLTAFDRDFFANVDSRILDDICDVLQCEREEIEGVRPVKAGLSNLSTLFSVRGEQYIYRYPGAGTNELVNREAEVFALNVAKEIGLDDTYIHADAREGWKISRYIEGCSELDYGDMDQVRRALQMARKLHTSGKTSPWSFDFHEEGLRIVGLLRDMGYPLPHDFDELAERVSLIAQGMRREAGEPALCHNDFYAPNFLVRGDEMRLIDWEYAAMGDPICDIGNFVSQGSGYTVEQTLAILPFYYGREATEQEERHALAAVALVGWYWYVWAMYKEAVGNPAGEWLYIWYRAAKLYSAAALPLYGG